MDYQYSYLIGDLVFLVIWFVLFILRKDLRKKMLLISIFFGVIGLIFEVTHALDWWTPHLITNTPIGIEDFLFGFAIGGIATGIYGGLFKKRVVVEKKDKKKIKKENLHFLIMWVFIILFYFICFFVFNLHSFYAAIITMGIFTVYILIKRKDLILNSLISGLILVVISFFAFWICEFITPGWVNHVWMLKNLSGVIILKVPLEDLIWFFFAGVFIAPLYEYWQETKIAEIKKKK